MFPIFSCICSKSKEMANTYFYNQMSYATQNTIVFRICAQNCYKTQQQEMEQGWCWSILRLWLLRLKLSCSFHVILLSQGKLRQHKAEAPFCFLLLFFLGLSLQAGLQKLHFEI